MYLMAAGVSGGGPIIGAWNANNSEPHYRRATSVALAVLAANAVCFLAIRNILSFIILIFLISFQGGILSTWSYPTTDGPKFRTTTIMNLMLYVVYVSLCLIRYRTPVFE